MAAENRRLISLQLNFIELIKSLSEESRCDLINYITSLQKLDKIRTAEEIPKTFKKYDLFSEGTLKFLGNLPDCNHIMSRDADLKPLSGFNMKQINKIYPGYAVFSLHLSKHHRHYVNFNATFYYFTVETYDRFQFFRRRVYITFWFDPVITFSKKQEIFEMILYYLEERFAFFRKEGIFNLKAEMMEKWNECLSIGII